MSTSTTRTQFTGEVDAWDEGPHTMFMRYRHVSDSARIYIKTLKAGRLIELVWMSAEELDALCVLNSGEAQEATPEECNEIRAHEEQNHWPPSRYGWISVQEQLPERNVDVLLLLRSGKQTVDAIYVKDDTLIDWYSRDNVYEADPITHWQSLPPNPLDHPSLKPKDTSG